MVDRWSVVIRGHWSSRPVTTCPVSVAIGVRRTGRILGLVCGCLVVAVLSTLLGRSRSRGIWMRLVLRRWWRHRLLLLWLLWLLHVWRLRILLAGRRSIDRSWHDATLWSRRCCVPVLLLLLVVVLLLLLLLRLLLLVLELVLLSHLLLGLATGQRSCERLVASVTGRSRSSRRLHNRRRCSEWVVCVVVWWCVGSTCHLRALIRCRVFVLIPILASLGITRVSAHPDIATYTHATALLRDGAAEGGAFGQTRELLRTVHL